MFHLKSNSMKEFAVLCQIGAFAPSVEETFDNPTDASAYANILRRRYTNRKYAVFQLNEAL